MKLLLAQYAFGRMLLYVGCALRGGNARLHLAGRSVPKLSRQEIRVNSVI